MWFCFQCRDNFETTREEAKSLMEKMLEVRGPVIICCKAFFCCAYLFLIDIVSMLVISGASFLQQLCNLPCFDMPSVLWCCWLGGRQGIRPVKNWVVRYWHGYLYGARCKWFAYGPADSTATPSSLALLKSRMVYLSGAGLPRLFWKKRPSVYLCHVPSLTTCIFRTMVIIED